MTLRLMVRRGKTDEGRAIADERARAAEKVVEPMKADIVGAAKDRIVCRRMLAATRIRKTRTGGDPPARAADLPRSNPFSPEGRRLLPAGRGAPYCAFPTKTTSLQFRVRVRTAFPEFPSMVRKVSPFRGEDPARLAQPRKRTLCWPVGCFASAQRAM